MTTTTQLPPEELAARKAAIARQQAADLNAAVDVDAVLHKLADKLHNEAFAAGKTPSFADSLKAAATDLIAQAAKNPAFPAAALARLRIYAPETAAAPEPAPADPIAAVEAAAEQSLPATA